ncbi:hypothetical protein UFOVP336_56 [uncultured Caudovirales phage]|uniref:Uncharacterized protein n=1 Tax=uncultured Caudovirales phage TaxID=2100421 RepID=A0A6J5LY70_9CAUD|nr:hypothetical protein UFOVP336_56 [uncultured Caudovirales phage]
MATKRKVKTKEKEKPKVTLSNSGGGRDVVPPKQNTTPRGPQYNITKPADTYSGPSQKRIGNSTGAVGPVKQGIKNMGAAERVPPRSLPAPSTVGKTAAKSVLGRLGGYGAAAVAGYELASMAGDAYVNKVKSDLDKDRVKLVPAPERKASSAPAPQAAPKAPQAKAAPKASSRAKSSGYNKGGVREGPHKGIGDDVRARAMAQIKASYQSEGSSDVDVNEHKWKGNMYEEEKGR